MNIKKNFKEDFSNPEIEINFNLIFNLIKRHKRFIVIFSLITFFIPIFHSKFSKKLWQGQFEIVIRKENNNLIEALPLNSDLNNIFQLNRNDKSIITEVEILKSPSLLLPIFEFVKSQKINYKSNYQNINFRSWLKNNLDFDLKNNTSILELKYKDYDKDKILPILEKISSAYQDYSGKNRRRNILLASNYFSDQIKKYKIKSSKSFREAQDYSIEQDLNISQYNINPRFNSKMGEEPQNKTVNESIINLEETRVKAANRIRTIDFQIQKIKELDNDSEQFEYISSSIPLLNESNLMKELELIDRKIAKLKSKYTDKDISLISAEEERLVLINLLKNKSIGYLKADKLATEALMESVARPKSVLIKYRELIREAKRDETILLKLENELKSIELEKAKLEDPWELITKPTLMQNPLPKNTLQKSIFALIFGFTLSLLVSYIFEKRKGLIFDKEILSEKLNSSIIDEIYLEKGSFKSYTKEIIQNEILDISSRKISKVIISESLTDSESKISIKNIFSNQKQYEIIESLNNLNDDDKIIFICKMGSLKLKEIESLKRRLNLVDVKLFGIFLIK